MIAHTNEKTFLHFARDTSTAGACRTQRNINGGQQTILVLDSCPAGMLAHEIGHAVGLNHEHQRADRDYYVQIFQPYLEKIRSSDLDLELFGGVDMGPYDLASLMHYGRYFTLKSPKNSTMETIPAGMVMGLLTNLSDVDIDQLRRVYGAAPTATTISTNPPGLQVIVDGAPTTAPQSFNWSPGSSHTVDIADPQFLSSDSTTRYLFGRWSDNQPKSHAITASSTVTVFEVSFIQQFKMTTGSTPSNGGTVSVSPPSADGFYTNNATVTLTASPASGFRFLVWGPSGILGQYHGYSDNPVTFPMKNPLTYAATFTTDQAVTINSSPPDLQVTVDGLTPVAPRAFDWQVGSTHTIGAQAMIYNQWSTIRSVFTGWSDGGAATHSIMVPAALPQTITANYKTQYMLTTQVSGTGATTVSPPSADGFYDAGTVVQITASPGAGFKFGGWSGDLQGQSSTQSLTMSDEMVVTASFARPFTIDATGIVNSASYQYTPLSPGEIVVIFGLEIGPPALTTLQLNSSNAVATLLAGTRVLFNGTAGPIVYTSQNQIAAIVPYEISGSSTANIQVELNGQRTNTVDIPVGLSAPGIYSANGSGLRGGAILNQDNSLNTSANPASRGSAIVLFATGEGQTNPGGSDGKVASPPFPKPQQPVSVLLGGPAGILIQGSALLYAGAAPDDTAGVLQVNLIIPVDAPSGDVPISVVIGNQRSPDWLTVAIR